MSGIQAAPQGSASFSLNGQPGLVAGGLGNSGRFQLQSCLNVSPTGIGSSGSFRLQSGCVTALAAANAAPAGPGSGGSSGAVPIPLGQGAWTALLILLLLFTSQLFPTSRKP